MLHTSNTAGLLLPAKCRFAARRRLPRGRLSVVRQSALDSRRSQMSAGYDDLGDEFEELEDDDGSR